MDRKSDKGFSKKYLAKTATEAPVVSATEFSLRPHPKKPDPKGPAIDETVREYQTEGWRQGSSAECGLKDNKLTTMVLDPMPYTAGTGLKSPDVGIANSPMGTGVVVKSKGTKSPVTRAEYTYDKNRPTHPATSVSRHSPSELI